MKRERGFALFVVGLMVVASLGGALGPASSAQTASAASAGSIVCDIAYAMTFGLLDPVSTCGDDPISESTKDKIMSLEDLQQKLSLHALGSSAHATAKQYRTSLSNFLVDSRSIASMKAKAAAVRLINNGTTNATKIRNAMHDAIEDYYARLQRNLIARWNAQAAQLGYMANTAQNDSGIADGANLLSSGDTHMANRAFVQPNITETDNQAGTNAVAWWNTTPTKTVKYTLINGSVVNVTALGIEVYLNSETSYPDAGKRLHLEVIWKNETYSHTANDFTVEATVTGSAFVREVSGVNESTNASAALAISGPAYADVFNSIAEQTQTLKSNYNLDFSQNVVSSYKSGELNLSEVVTPEMLAQQWAPSYNETGSSVYRWANIAALGLDSPSLKNVSHMTVDYRKQTAVRYVTFNVTGTPTQDGPYNISVNGEQVGHVVTSDEKTNTVRVAVPLETDDDPTTRTASTVTVTTYGGFSKEWNTSEVDAGETLTIEGVTLTAEQLGTWDRVTEQGFLFARNAPSDGWQVGMTYTASNITGSEFFVPAGNTTRLTKLEGDFTLVGAETQTGENLSVVHVRNYNYQTSNASKLIEQLNQLETLYNQTETRIVKVSGGSSSGMSQNRILLLLGIAIAAAVIANQGKD